MENSKDFKRTDTRCILDLLKDVRNRMEQLSDSDKIIAQEALICASERVTTGNTKYISCHGNRSDIDRALRV